ncbi:MAG: pyruvate formate lyase family protein [Thermodesulfobacteriota bacterium]
MSANVRLKTAVSGSDNMAEAYRDSCREPSPRITAIRADLFSEPYSICLERPKLLRRFRNTPEGRPAGKDHPLVRRAKSLAYLMSRRRPRIYAGELIIGNMTSKRIAANYYPEGGSINILEDLFRLEKRQIPLVLTTREKIDLAVIGLSGAFASVGARALIRPGRIRHFLDFFRAKRYFITEEAGIGHQVGGYHGVVHDGLQAVDRIAEACLETGFLKNGEALNADQQAFYQAIRITIRGIRAMAANLAAEAERLADSHDTPESRRTELRTAAAACRHVPYHPARSFQEGLQACWLVHVAMNLEDFEQGMSFGRLDRILLPLFRKDLEQGRLTRGQATEIMASFQLKTCETIPIYSERIDRYFSGNGVAQGITVGGTDEDGLDSTNELSGIVLDAFAQIRTREPALHVRVHDETPAWFLEKAVETVQLGCGKPSFFGDTAVVRALESAGMSTPHARDYAVIGCVEMASQGRTYNSSDAALFNLPLCLELALNRGYCYGEPHYGVRMGAATPAVTRMHSFDDVVAAFRVQVAHAMAEMVKVIGWLEATYRIWRPTPVNSMVTQGCLESGRDVTWGGALYDLTSIQAAGLADTGDSLHALKTLVFDERRISLSELLTILKSNFKDHPVLQQELLRRFPKYGNDIAAVDRMTQLAADVYADAVTTHRNSRGGRYVPGIYSMTCHIAFGRRTGALPNGRGAGMRLSNGLSPADGADRKGPTAILNSAASLDSSRWSNCCALNLMFDRRTVQGAKGRRVLSNLFRAYFQQGGMQVQANVLDADMLRAARQNPADYPGIVVRVAGYCAYFRDLQPSVQDEIIARTAHGIQ